MTGYLDLKLWKVVWPVCLGYLPMGLACGMFAQKAGLNVWEVTGMCAILYAGSGQFISLAMMMQSASIVSIVLTIFVVNLRHFLFSSTLINYLRDKSPAFLAAYAHEITDESFAVNLSAFQRGDWSPEEAIRLNNIAHVTWILSNIAGFWSSELITVDTQLVGYALTSMFIGLWSFYLDDRRMLVAGFLAGLLAVVFSLFVGYRLHIVLAAVTVAGLCAYIEYSVWERVGDGR